MKHRQLRKNIALLLLICGPLSAADPVTITQLDNDTIQASFELPSTVDRVWAVITNYENSPNVMPNIKKATIISSQHSTDVNVDYVTSVAGAGPFTVTYTSKITAVKSKGIINWEQVKGPFVKNYGSWSIKAVSDKLTKVVYTATLNHKYMPDRIKRSLVKKSIPDLYESLKKHSSD